MKKILITGLNSYIGTSFEKWALEHSNDFLIETLDMHNANWKEKDFSQFDVVFHVAGIAHVSSKKKLDTLYFKVNRDLAVSTAQKAKAEGVKQFIFMSSMIIYGRDNRINNFRNVDTSVFKPINAYGKSKLEADLFIKELSSSNFKTVIIRSPAVFGPGCKGNFPRLQKLALKMPFFPNLANQRSMIYIDNLSEFIMRIVELEKSGTFYPQNEEYVCTKSVVELTRKAIGKKYRETKLFNPLIKLFSFFIPTINKVFGNKTYDLKESCVPDINYYLIDLEEAIARIT